MIRTLRHGELPPEGVEPRRYKSSQGYIRLRWSIGHGDYVECYEHRWVMGNPPPDVEVHHVNHVKDDNRPENLKVVTPTEHGAEHRGIDRDEAIRLYRAGYGTPTIAAQMGHNPAAIYRAIRDAGEPMRDAEMSAALLRIADDDLPSQELAYLYSQGASAERLAGLYGVSQSVVLSRLCELGVPRRRAGRSTAAQVARAEAAIAEAVRS